MIEQILKSMALRVMPHLCAAHAARPARAAELEFFLKRRT